MSDQQTVDFNFFGRADGFRLRVNGIPTAHPVLTGEQMPGQCGILVLYDLSGKNWPALEALTEEAEKIAAKDGYPWLMASTVSAQTRAENFLKASGWDPFWSFENARTFNQVTLWRKAVANVVPGIHHTA